MQRTDLRPEAPAASRLQRVAPMLVGLAAAAMAHAEPLAVAVTVEEPRAFGHLVGDVVTRRIVLDVPGRLSLVEASLPVPGRVGQSFELRRVLHERDATTGGTRHRLQLDYQVFRAPREPRVLDLPSFTLEFAGQPRHEELRIDYAPVGVVPLTPGEPVLRAGFGVLRPDRTTPSIDTRPERWRLVAYALAALAPLGYLLTIHLGWPWWRRRQQPFARAQRQLGALPLDASDERWTAAWRVLHAALDASAGRVVHIDGLERFLGERPRYATLRDDLARFFERSQAIFFRGHPPAQADRQWLRDFCRRCFDVERGAA